jgi:hypothetical protein
VSSTNSKKKPPARPGAPARLRPPKPRRKAKEHRVLHGEEKLEYLRGKRRGEECEALVRRVLSRPDRPWWLLKVRAARPIEDKSGVDIIVYTADLGRLFLQVKRSPIDVDNWYREHVNDSRPIRVIVAHEETDPEVVYGRALGALIILREQVECGARA